MWSARSLQQNTARRPDTWRGSRYRLERSGFRFLTGGLADGRPIDMGRVRYCRQHSHVVMAAHQGGLVQGSLQAK
jgi:hypothetical protein